jgi:hypothetical protein
MKRVDYFLFVDFISFVIKQRASLQHYSKYNFIPFLTGSKTPTSRFERYREDKLEITARKDQTKDRMSKSGKSHRTWRFMRDKFR